MDKIIFWGAAIATGVLLGAFLRLSVVMWVLGGAVVVAFVGGFGAAFGGLIRPEWLYLLMIVLPLAGVLFASAAVSNALIGAREKRGPKTKGSDED